MTLKTRCHTLICLSALVCTGFVCCSKPIHHEGETKNSAAKQISNNLPVRRYVETKSILQTSKRQGWEATLTMVAEGQDLGVVQFVDGSQGWAGSRAGTLYQTTDGGTSWKRANLDVPKGAQVASLSFANATLGWVLLQKNATDVVDFQDNQSWIMRTTDGGLNWSQQWEQRGTVIKRILFADPQNGWIVGLKILRLEPYEGGYLVFRTSDSGEHWMDLSKAVNGLLVKDGDSLTDVHVEPSQEVTLLSQRGKVFRTLDVGANWSHFGTIENEPAQTGLNRIGVEKGHAWVAGGAHSIEGTCAIFASAQANSWLRNILTGFYFRDLVFSSETEMFACGFFAGERGATLLKGKTEGVILRSSDGGKHWEIVYRNGHVKSINALAATDPNLVWAVGDNGAVIRLERKNGEKH
jgi:photosystem II stability/assembly factor-like uncharacterized protein